MVTIATVRTVVAIVTSALAVRAGAQGLPTPVDPAAINAEQQRRQHELDAAPALPPGPAVTVTPNTAAPATTSGVRFVLTRVEFDASAYLKPDVLAALAQPYVGREVGFAEVDAIVRAVNARYAALGIVTARAVLPAQTVAGGVVRVRLAEGRFGRTRVDGGSARGQARALDRVRLPTGQLASAHAVENALLRFNRTGDAQLRATVAPGVEFGQTDILLSLVEPRRFQADLTLDNNGFASTGTLQGGASLRAYRLLSAGDRLAVSGNASGGVVTGSASYSLDLGPLRGGVSYAHGVTRVTDGQFASLDIRGTSDTAGANGAALLASNARFSLLASLSAQYTASRTSISGMRVGDSRIMAGDVGLTAGISTPGFNGSIAQAISYADIDDRLHPGRSSAVIARGSAFAAVRLSRAVQFRLRGDWQVTDTDDLNGVLQYQAGGSRSSRAFAPGSAGGDTGYGGSAELAYQRVFGKVLIEPYLFTDRSDVFSTRGTARLGSAGAGITLAYAQRLTLELYAAHRLTTPTANLPATRVVGTVTMRF